MMEPVLDEFKVPCITITLVDSSEAGNEMTLGDVHSTAFEYNDTVWPALTGPLTPRSYVPSTGIVILKAELSDISLAPGMSIIDYSGAAHEIVDVIDNLTFKISPNTVADFRNAVIKPHRPAYITSIESTSYRETYRIGVHVGAEPVYLTWLHSILVYVLHRYKEALLEARGFERTILQSSDFARESQHETELVFSRHITIVGYVRQYWPKVTAPVIDAVVMDGIRVSGQGADVLVKGTGVDPDEQLWVGNLDTLDPNKRK